MSSDRSPASLPAPGPSGPTLSLGPSAGEPGILPLPAAGDVPGNVTLPGYEVFGLLGRGGMGVVYAARQQGLGRVVALKVVLAGAHAGEAERARFRTEAETIARLQHPGVVQVFEVGDHDGLPFIALEYCPGGTLEKKLAGTPLPPREAAALVEQLARAVHAAHQKGVVHRDLKPANVLFGEDGTPKVVDFGLAKKLDEAGQTQTGAVVGTPSYMAPEQAAGQARGGTSPVGPAADVYALGAILYECLTGRPPFKAATPLDTLFQVIHEEAVPPARLQPGTPRPLETVCLKCLQKDPRRRYRSASELADDLKRFQNGEPVHARPVGRLERAWLWCRRKPALAATGALAVLALLSLAAVSLVFAVHTSLAADELRAEQGRTRAALESVEDEQGHTRSALAEEKRQRGLADERLRLAQRRLAENELERGLTACTLENDPSLGLLWMARALRSLPEGEPDLERVLRTNLSAWGGRAHALRAVFEHRNEVKAVAFSEDGKSVWTAHGGATAHFTPPSFEGTRWDVGTRQRMSGPTYSQWGVRGLVYSPDLKALLAVGGGGPAVGRPAPEARLWDAASNKSRGLPMLHDGPVLSADLDNGGKTVLTGCGDGTAHLWDPATGKRRVPPLKHPGAVTAAALSPDGKTALTGCADGAVRRWNAETGKLVESVLAGSSAITALCCSPDGKLVAAGTAAGTARWDRLDTRRFAGPAGRHVGAVSAVAVSPDGRLVVTGGEDGKAQLWEAATGLPVGPPLMHRDQITSAAFSRDGRWLVTGGADRDRTARLWELAPPAPVPTRLPFRGQLQALAVSPDGKLALAGGQGETVLWDLEANGPLPVPAIRGIVLAAGFSPDGKYVAVGLAERRAVVWEVRTGKVVSGPMPHGGYVSAVAFSADGKTLATGDYGSQVRRWDVGTWKLRGKPCPVDGVVTALALSRTGQRALVVSVRGFGTLVGAARPWDLEAGKPLGKGLPHREVSLLAGAISPGGRTLLTGGKDRTARLWDAATGKPLGYPLQHQATVLAVAFSPDGKTVLTGCEDRTAQLWDAATGRRLGPPLRHTARVPVVGFRTDGRQLLTGGPDGTVRRWEVPQPLPGSPEQIALWAEVLSGRELTHGAVEVIGGGPWAKKKEAWTERRRQLEQLAGPPRP
jgi:WD40 repeat protein